MSNQKSTIKKIGAGFAAATAVALASVVPAGGTAQAASGTHTYGNGCQIKISGFEHYGVAAASTRDNNAACFEIQARVKYKDSSNNFNFVTGGVETDSYTRVTAGQATDWEEAYGRSPSVSSQYYAVAR